MPSSGGGDVTVNVPGNGEYDRRGFLTQCSLMLYANSEFDRSEKSVRQIADDAVERAMVMTEKLIGMRLIH